MTDGGGLLGFCLKQTSELKFCFLNWTTPNWTHKNHNSSTVDFEKLYSFNVMYLLFWLENPSINVYDLNIQCRARSSFEQIKNPILKTNGL